MKTTTYLTDPFTIEFDSYFVPGTYGPMAMLMYNDKVAGYEREAYVHLNRTEIGYSGNDVSFSKNLPEEIAGETFDDKWHHVAIAFKNNQLKVYVDQYRVLVVPDTKQTFDRLEITGIGDDKSPIIVKNVRIASGGDMNMLGKKFTESKIVTHGINFDIDKATIKPESMGTLNMIVKVMTDNPEIKFQVQGHTDNTGTPAHNLTLSQQRADAVKDQLIKMGIDASRLSSKGFGDTKPIGDNSTIDGKANNRRVEFVKM
jgi:outer membrane protein OmpA-like peptidoglycan-associated protein